MIMIPQSSDENSSIGSSNAAWLGRLITRVETSVDMLGGKIEGLERAIASDMKDMRDGFRREVNEVEARVNTLEYRLAQVDLVNKILAAVGGAMLISLIGLGIPRIWGNQSVSPAPTQQLK